MSRVRRRLLWFAGGTSLLLVLVLLLGFGSMSQFSPVTFEHRSVTTWHIPYTGELIFSIPSKPRRARIVQFWIGEGYLKPESGPTDRWHIITGSASAPGWRLRSSGYAKYFWWYCQCSWDEDAEQWIAWSRRHPELAADLWPRVVGYLQKAADPRMSGECYVVAGMLMHDVRQAEDAKAYHERVAKWRQDNAEFLAVVD
jgi:hypothetical protein